MRQRRLLLPDEARDFEKRERNGNRCYAAALILLVVLLLLGALTDGFPFLPQPYFSWVKRWMGTGVGTALFLALWGFILNRRP